jgi:hypothetical protein
MNRLRRIALISLALVGACGSLPPRTDVPQPSGDHSCYRSSTPLLSRSAARLSGQWLVLSDRGGEAVGAHWYGGRIVEESGAWRPVRWQSVRGGSSIRVRWNEGSTEGTMELNDRGTEVAGTAQSGTQNWHVRATRVDCGTLPPAR